MPKQMSIALVGCGRIGPAHARAADESPLCRITCCATRHTESAEAFADEWSIPKAYGSLEELLAKEEVDLVLLATWPADHLEQIRLCYEHGKKAILCEKALAMNGEEGDEIARIVADNDAFLMEGLMYRHHPQIQRARKLIEEGVIGDVGYIAGYFSDRIVGTPDTDNWRFKPELGGGTMTAKGCYMVDSLSFLAGTRPLKAISYMSMSDDGTFDVGHTGTIIFDGGITAHFESNHRTIWREEIRVVGTEGVILIPHAIVTATQKRQIVITKGGRFEREPVHEESEEFDVANSYRLQLENAYDCIFGDGKPVVTLEESVSNLKLTSALLKSTQTGRFEEVER
jgi:predicted dehydrogenase